MTAAALPSRAMRRAARRAWAAAVPAGLRQMPVPVVAGDPARGRRILGGTFRHAGQWAAAPGRSPWDIPLDPGPFAEALHGFAWLDDLMACASPEARATAQRWYSDWIDRYADGAGPGWTITATAARLMNWLRHAQALAPVISSGPGARMARARAAAAMWLLGRARKDFGSGAGAISVAVARGQGAICLDGVADETMLGAALSDLGAVLMAEVGRDGGLASRNPEALQAAFSDLACLRAGLEAAGRPVPPELYTVLERMAPALRLLRHKDGTLARWHGGGRGGAGMAELAFAAAASEPGWVVAEAMGFRRLTAGRTSIVIDAAPPPTGPSAHAGTLAFELTSGRRPVIVNCGPGEAFGPHWRRFGRATEAHSTLALTGVASARARLGAAHPGGVEPGLPDAPREVTAEPVDTIGTGLVLSHDGYAASHGLQHIRRLELSADGRALGGEDMLGAFSPYQQQRLSRVLARSPGGIGFALHFHLHPEAEVEGDAEGRSVSILLPSGEVWTFRADAALRLAPSVYLDPGEVAPGSTWQIVIPGRITGGPARIGWTLAKAAQSPVAVRDTIDADRPMAG
jgi:uncharacterized heparinase superfamily protein